MRREGAGLFFSDLFLNAPKCLQKKEDYSILELLSAPQALPSLPAYPARQHPHDPPLRRPTRRVSRRGAEGNRARRRRGRRGGLLPLVACCAYVLAAGRSAGSLPARLGGHVEGHDLQGGHQELRDGQGVPHPNCRCPAHTLTSRTQGVTTSGRAAAPPGGSMAAPPRPLAAGGVSEHIMPIAGHRGARRGRSGRAAEGARCRQSHCSTWLRRPGSLEHASGFWPRASGVADRP